MRKLDPSNSEVISSWLQPVNIKAITNRKVSVISFLIIFSPSPWPSLVNPFVDSIVLLLYKARNGPEISHQNQQVRSKLVSKKLTVYKVFMTLLKRKNVGMSFALYN